MIKLKHYLSGNIQIELYSFSPERFLNLCRSHGLEIWGLEHQKESYRFFMTIRGYKKIKPLVRKSHVRLKIVARYGLPFFMYRNRQRRLFAFGFAAFFGLLYMLSLFIWDIQFEGNTRYTQDLLITYFNEQNITHGMLKSKVSCSQIEDYLRTDFPEITWVSARISGTRLLVKIKENEVLSAVPQSDESPCNIVATKAGIITSMIVRSGTAQVSIGDEVEPGQLLVAGEVVIKNDSDEVTNIHYVTADADIEAQTVYQYQKEIPQTYRQTVETGKKKQGLFLNGFGHSAVLMLPSKPETQWKYVMEEKQLKLFYNFYLPFYMGKISGKEYIIYDRFYTGEEKNALMNQLHENFMEDLTEKGVQILQNNVRMVTNGSNCYIEGLLITREPIITREQIIRQEETRELDERSGEYP